MKENDKNEALKLKNQICFPLYAVSNMITRRYKPLLEKLDLTYTQYITMMVLWENKEINVKKLGECLYLDSGTLTPLLKKLENKGYIERKRDSKDERNLNISITEEGEKLKNKATCVPMQMANEIKLEPQEAKALYETLYKLLENCK